MASGLEHVRAPEVGRDSCTPRRHRSSKEKSIPDALENAEFLEYCNVTAVYEGCLEYRSLVYWLHMCEEADEMQMGCNCTARGIYWRL